MYPIQLNLADKNVVIIGAGRVSYRKLQQLLDEDIGSLVIISKKFLPQFFEIEHPKMKMITKCYDKTDIQYADIIIAATNDQRVNQQIKREAHQYQWVNQASDKEESDFFNMTETSIDDIKIHVRSNGKDCKKVKNINAIIQAYLKEVYKEDMYV